MKFKKTLSLLTFIFICFVCYNKTESKTVKKQESSVNNVKILEQESLTKTQEEAESIEVSEISEETITNALIEESAETIAFVIDRARGRHCDNNDRVRCEPKTTKNTCLSVQDENARPESDKTCVTFRQHCIGVEPDKDSLELATKIKEALEVNPNQAVSLLKSVTDNPDLTCTKRDDELSKSIVYCEVNNEWSCSDAKDKKITEDTVMCYAKEDRCII